MNIINLMARNEYFFLTIILFPLLFSLSACGNVEIDTPTVGNINLHVKWEDTKAVLPDDISSSDYCADLQTIEAFIYDATGKQLYNRSWPCTKNLLVLENVPIGHDQKLVIKAKNGDSRIIYYGEADIRDINSGMMNIEIVPERFEASLYLPVDKDTLSNNELKFKWDPVLGALSYHVQVSENPLFNELIIDEIVLDEFLKPEILLQNGTYYCRIHPLTEKEEEGLWPTAKEFNIFWEPWAKNYGPDSYHTQALHVTETSDGGFIATGNTEAIGITLPDIYLIKTDSYGELEWEAFFGKPGTPDSGMMVIETIDEKYLILANTSYPNFPDDACDIVLIEVDCNGKNPVEKTININHFANYGSSLSKTADGGYIIAGVARLNDGGEGDILLIKLDAALNILNSKTYSYNGNQGAFACTQTENGGYIISAMTDTLGNGSIDVFIMKTNSELDEEWHEIFGGDQWDGMDSDVQPTVDGGYIFVSSTESQRDENPDHPSPAHPAAWVVKLNSQGKIEWEKTYGEIETLSRGYSIHQEAAGDGYIIAGITEYFSDLTHDDAWLIKIDSQGEIEWDKIYDTSNYERVHSVHPISQGGYIISGSTSWVNEDKDVYGKALLIATDEIGNPLIKHDEP